MAQGNVTTPFLDTRSFVREESELFSSESPTPALGSPFVSVYEVEGYTEFFTPQEEANSTLVQELYDEEFDEALFELMADARSLHMEQLVSNEIMDGERFVHQHFDQLVREAESTVDAFQREFGKRDVSGLAEGEIDAFAERFEPSPGLRPEFENFLGKWAKKIAKGVKGVVKKAVQVAKKIGLGPILAKLKALVQPLLNKVLQAAIGKLPEAVRPAAQKLADRIFRRKAAPAPAADTEPVAAADAAGEPAQPDLPDTSITPLEDPGSAVQEPAGSDVTDIQQEFDQQLADLFLASDEVELELEVARIRSEARQQTTPVYADLEQAREGFINELHKLREGEDPTPHVENFLPAVLPVLRLGIRLVGRGRVVGFLAKLLAKLISKLVGPETAPALSRAIVEAGLKLLTLELSPQDESRAAASAVAATVEETVRRVSNLPDYVLDNQELLEGFVLEAFEQAAAANLPPVLSESVYRERPDLLESTNSKTCWIMLPLRRAKRYKKCGRTFKVRISPFMADEIETFEGPLADYLQDQLGIEEGAEVEAEVHLYETIPGTTLPDIAREESETPGMGNTSVAARAQLHPLTAKAAGMLLGAPKLGRNIPAGSNQRSVGVGQRLYHLSIPGKRLLTVPGPNGRSNLRRVGGVKVTFDSPRDEIRISVFMSEVKAQKFAVRLRRKTHPGAMAASFQKYVSRRLAPILLGQRPGRIRVVQSGLAPKDVAAAMKNLPAEVLNALAAKIHQSVVSTFATYLGSQSQRIIAATEDTADGITLKFTIAAPPGLKQICLALARKGHVTGLVDVIRRGNKPVVQLTVHPGYKGD